MVLTPDAGLLFFIGCWCFLGAFASCWINDPPQPDPARPAGWLVRLFAFLIAWPLYVAADATDRGDAGVTVLCGGWVLAALILIAETLTQ